MSMSTSKLRRSDALAALGVHAGASRDEIEAAWKKRVFETHPDRNEGTSDEFMRINAAYGVLRRERPRPIVNDVPREPAPRPAAPSSGHPAPRRRKVAERNDEVSADALRLCERKLDATDGGTRHVPHMIRRQGRNVTYLIRTPLERGANHIALPTGELIDHRRVSAIVLEFEAFREGGHTLEVTEPSLSRDFPGAKTVTIQFGADI